MTSALKGLVLCGLVEPLRVLSVSTPRGAKPRFSLQAGGFSQAGGGDPPGRRQT
jgi:hypothetical protein